MHFFLAKDLHMSKLFCNFAAKLEMGETRTYGVLACQRPENSTKFIQRDLLPFNGVLLLSAVTRQR